VADGWCWFVLREEYCWLVAAVAGGWFVLREKYCWLVADKPSEQALLAQRGGRAPPPTQRPGRAAPYQTRRRWERADASLRSGWVI
jgi:hypothetical protein